MVLDDEQNGLFFDVMDSLLYYVNDRFSVVEGFTLEFASPLDDVKSSLVARTLWENVAIIDDFVRDNPYGLSKRCLDIARTWKSALPGMYTLVRYQSGRALLMGEAGVFAVSGVTYELEEEIGPAPAYIDIVLLPFEDLIVYDGFLQAYDVEQSSTEIQRIQDEFENRCAKGIALNGTDFIQQANSYLAEMRDREIDALLADVAREVDQGEEQLPSGFHRGALAGLSADARRQAVDEWIAENVPAPTVTAREFDERVRKREPVTSLDACLKLLTKAQLEDIAEVMGMGGLSRLKKAEMVEELAAELVNAPLLLDARLAMAEDADYEFAQRLAIEGRIDFGLGERDAHMFIWPIEPYVFLFRGRAGYSAVVPEELRPLFSQVDFAVLDRVRRQRNQAFRCMDACVTFCGVVAVDDVYDQYRALVADVLSREDFGNLVELETMIGYASFGLWTYLPNDYLVHYTLTPEFVAEDYARRQSETIDGLMRNTETGELSFAPIERMFGRIRDDLAKELEQLEQYKRDLVESQSNLPIKTLSRSLLENDVIGELLDDENVGRLRAFIDAHIPDGQNDFTFADWMTENIVLSCIESGSVQSVFSYVMEWGLERSSEDDERLPMLITNVFNAMPSWENNGWSPQELYEQVTGRKMFYNEDGTIMKIGADDPCPCRSGKKYRDCCGR